MDISTCPVCGDIKVHTYFHLRCNDLISMRCQKCSHVFIKNSPINSNNASEYYTMEDFQGKRKLQSESWYTNYYHDCLADYESYLDSSLILKQFREKLDYFNSCFPERGRLLDIGCATGVFLDMAKKHGWDAEGVEISSDLASYAREKFLLKVHTIDLTKQKLNCSPYDAISLFDVIEHIPDVNKMIASCKELLSDNGLVLIRTPTEEGFLRDIAKLVYRISFHKYELPMLWFYSFEHIQSFSLKSLNKLLENHGFSTIKVFREEESLDRINIPWYLGVTVKGINRVSAFLNKEHKMTIIARKK